MNVLNFMLAFHVNSRGQLKGKTKNKFKSTEFYRISYSFKTKEQLQILYIPGQWHWTSCKITHHMRVQTWAKSDNWEMSEEWTASINISGYKVMRKSRDSKRWSSDRQQIKEDIMVPEVDFVGLRIQAICLQVKKQLLHWVHFLKTIKYWSIV